MKNARNSIAALLTGWLLMSLSLGLAHAAQLPDFVELTEKHSSAVVNISTTKHMTRDFRLPEGMDIPHDTPFYEFFRKFFEQQPGGPETFETTSLGSGFVISTDGYILTNHHVIEEADKIVVRLKDRRELEAELIGSDVTSDIALLKVDASNLPVVKIGDSDKLKQGQWVFAIGSPFGFDHSVTAGIVSAKGRSLPAEDNSSYVPFIQTDVAINPGNSGGPLFDLDGEVVGVNSQIYSRTGGFMGLSFAIPINDAMDVVEQLKKEGRVARGYLGVLIQAVTQELVEPFGLERPTGALVAQVFEESPARKSGIRQGDIILEFDGREVKTSNALPPMVGRKRPGDRVTVKVLRDGKEKVLHVTITELPERDVMAAGKPGQPDSTALLGMMLKQPGEDVLAALEIEAGAQVSEVEMDSAAGRAGLRPGDVITMLNHKPVTSPEDVRQIIEDIPAGKTAVVLVHRRGGPVFLALAKPQ